MSREEAARQVRRAVDATGLTRKEFAQQAGVDLGTLGDLLNGNRWPQPRTLVKIERALGWPAGRIADLEHGAVPPTDAPSLFAAIDADPDLLPEAKAHLKNQVELLLRLQAASASQEILERQDERRRAAVEDPQPELRRRLTVAAEQETAKKRPAKTAPKRPR